MGAPWSRFGDLRCGGRVRKEEPYDDSSSRIPGDWTATREYEEEEQAEGKAIDSVCDTLSPRFQWDSPSG